MSPKPNPNQRTGQLLLEGDMGEKCGRYRGDIGRTGQPLLELGRLDRRVEQVGAALEQPRKEEYAPGQASG